MIITGLYKQLNTNMHIKQLFDCDMLYEHITTSTANNDDNGFKIKEKHLFSSGQILDKASLATINTAKSSKICIFRRSISIR